MIPFILSYLACMFACVTKPVSTKPSLCYLPLVIDNVCMSYKDFLKYVDLLFQIYNQIGQVKRTGN